MTSDKTTQEALTSDGGATWMTRAEAATYARVAGATIDRAVQRGELVAAGRRGGRGRRVYRRADVDRWLEGLPPRDVPMDRE